MLTSRQFRWNSYLTILSDKLHTVLKIPKGKKLVVDQFNVMMPNYSATCWFAVLDYPPLNDIRVFGKIAWLNYQLYDGETLIFPTSDLNVELRYPMMFHEQHPTNGIEPIYSTENYPYSSELLIDQRIDFNTAVNIKLPNYPKINIEPDYEIFFGPVLLRIMLIGTMYDIGREIADERPRVAQKMIKK